MKILHLSSEKTWRGGEQQIAYLIEESMAKGLSCHLLLRQGSAMRDWAVEKGVPYKEVSFSNSMDIGTASALKKYANKEKFDFIHMHSGKSHDSYALAYLLGLRVPAVLSRRVDFPVKQNPWARWKYNLDTIKRVICVSDAIKDMTAPALRDPSKAVTVHSGIDFSRFSDSVDKNVLRDEFILSASSTLIGNVSALAPHKDYPTFLRTARAVIDRGIDAYFFIIGEGGERNSIEEMINSEGLQERVIMTGFREDVPAILRSLDIFLITSETEGLGTTILDAFVVGLPVVATKAGGIPESVIHEQTGLTCPVKDSACLAESVARMISDESLRKQVIAGATEHLKNFSKEQMAASTMAIYKDVLSNSLEGSKKSNA